MKTLFAGLALCVASCSGDPGPTTPTTDSTSDATTATASSTKPTTLCEEEPNCAEQGALAMMVSDKDRARTFYKRGCELSPGSKSCKELANLDGTPASSSASASASAPATASASAPGPAGLPGANLTIGATEADGMKLKDVSCIMKAGGGVGGLLGSLTVVAGVSKKKKELDACSKGETQTRVHFWQSGGKITKATAEGSDTKINACVEKALVGAPATSEAECLTTIMHGK